MKPHADTDDTEPRQPVDPERPGTTRLPALITQPTVRKGWLQRLFGSNNAAAARPTVVTDRDVPFPEQVLWVKDAPLFIDETNLAQFYDAAVRPAFDDAAPVKLKLSDSIKKDLTGKLAGKGTAGLANWLSFLASSSVEVSAEGQMSRSRTSGSETEIVLQPIKTPHRQLEQLAIYYALRSPEHLLFGNLDDVFRWQRDALSISVPRPLVFIDLPKGTKFIPMAAEFADRHTVTFFDKLRDLNGDRPPEFDPHKKNDYWMWFDRNFDPKQSLAVLEDAATTHGRIEWVDFRVPLNGLGDTLHVHIEAAGRYNTGTFGYRLIRRALGHGTRIVGTLRDGPDVHVLALYDK
ncbi:MAG: hypothetical protein E6R08_08655 [Nevskiaceae bacterium]|nr:MAG: hypothetical protein E6R08_08655 [Nevskiaceae bacterium]